MRVGSVITVLVNLVLLAGCGAGPGIQSPPTTSTVTPAPSPSAPVPQIHSAAVAMQVNLATSSAGTTIEFVDAQMGSSNMTTWGAPVTPSGRYVTFSGAPLDLAVFRATNCQQPNPPPACATPLYNDIYVRDTCLGTEPGCNPQTLKISVAADGPANGASIVSTISDDGRYVAFESAATNLVSTPPPATPAIYLSDTCLGAAAGCVPSTSLVSMASGGTPANNGSFRPRLTPDARFVLFRSLATNLAPGTIATNNLFLRDTCTNAPSGCVASTSLVSVAPDGTLFSSVMAGSLTPDGRFVTFTAWLQNGTTGAFRRDTCMGAGSGCTPATSAIGVDTNGAALKFSFAGAISSDGRYAYFESGDPSLLPGCTPDPVFGTCFTLGYLRDTCWNAPAGCAPANIRVTLGNDGSVPSKSASGDVGPGGRYVIFSTSASNMVANDSNGSATFDGTDIFVRDTCLGAADCQPATVRVTVAADGTQANNYCYNPAINTKGSYVTFWSLADTLIPGTPSQPAQGQVFRLYLAKIQ